MTTIAIDEQTHKEAKIICKTLELTLGELVQHGVLFFKKTGIDPSKSENESPLKAIEELNKRVGQVVSFMKKHEQDKLNPLYDGLILLKNTLGDSLKILPKSERFEAVIKAIDSYMSVIAKTHKEQIAFFKQSQQEIMQENKTELGSLATAIHSLTEAVNEMKAEQKAIKEAIETKLRKNILG